MLLLADMQAMKPSQKLASPLFLITVLLLVVNDWYLKTAYANTLTGKLSDFAGLFGLPFFLSALFPGKVKWWYGLTAIIFIFWKSVLAQPFIDTFNHIGVPVNRTVDYSDCLALSILPLSWYAFKNSRDYALKPVLKNAIIVLSAVSFIATSRPPGDDMTFNNINKVYHFNFSLHELIKRINAYQIDQINNFNKSGYYKVDFNSATGVYYYNKPTDTVAVMLDYEKLKSQDTIVYKTKYATAAISGNEQASEVRLIRITSFIPKSYHGEPKKKAIENFEYMVIKQIKKQK